MSGAINYETFLRHSDCPIIAAFMALIPLDKVVDPGGLGGRVRDFPYFYLETKGHEGSYGTWDVVHFHSWEWRVSKGWWLIHALSCIATYNPLDIIPPGLRNGYG